MKRQPTKPKFDREARAAHLAFTGYKTGWSLTTSTFKRLWRKVAAAVLREHKRKAR